MAAIIDLGDLIVWEAADGVREPGVGINGVELGGFDQGVGDGGGFAACLGADEEVVFAPEGNHPFILPMSVRNWRFITAGIPILVTRFAFGALSNGRQASFSRSWAQQASS